MKPSVWIVLLLLFLGACVPKVTMTVETRDPQGNIIDRGDVTQSDTGTRKFRVNSNGTITLTVSGQDSGGLQKLYFTGGSSCNRADGEVGTVQQGVFNATDPNLPGQNPTSESFTQTYNVRCSGGTYTGSVTGCATNAKGSSSCTKDATFF